MELTFGCGCVGVIPAIVLFGLLLLFGNTFWVALGGFMVVIGLMALFGLSLDIVGEVIS